MNSRGAQSIPLAIRNQLTEFFDSFYLVGYSLETGNRTIITHVPTSKDFDAIKTLLASQLQENFEPPTPVIAVKPQGRK